MTFEPLHSHRLRSPTRPGRHRVLRSIGAGIKALTKREKQVLEQYIVHGKQETVAHQLGTSRQTVKNQMSNILAKLDVDSSAQAVVLYDRSLGREWPAVERRAGERRQGERRR